jgi:hypothetical protein
VHSVVIAWDAPGTGAESFAKCGRYTYFIDVFRIPSADAPCTLWKIRVQ